MKLDLRCTMISIKGKLLVQNLLQHINMWYDYMTPEKFLRYTIWKRLFANELISIHVPSLWEKKFKNMIKWKFMIENQEMVNKKTIVLNPFFQYQSVNRVATIGVKCIQVMLRFCLSGNFIGYSFGHYKLTLVIVFFGCCCMVTNTLKYVKV